MHEAREAAHYHKDVATVRVQASVQDVAEQMAREAVGCLVVVDEREQPVGIVTDRDLAMRVVAAGASPSQTSAESVMSRPLVTVAASDSIEAVIACMSSRGIRRVPVVRDGKLAGLVSLDDLVVRLGGELESLGGTLRNQFREAQRSAHLEGLGEELRGRIRGMVEEIEHVGGQAKEGLLRELDSLRERLRRH